MKLPADKCAIFDILKSVLHFVVLLKNAWPELTISAPGEWESRMATLPVPHSVP